MLDPQGVFPDPGTPKVESGVADYKRGGLEIWQSWNIYVWLERSRVPLSFVAILGLSYWVTVSSGNLLKKCQWQNHFWNYRRDDWINDLVEHFSSGRGIRVLLLASPPAALPSHEVVPSILILPMTIAKVTPSRDRTAIPIKSHSLEVWIPLGNRPVKSSM